MADLHSYASRERDHIPSDLALAVVAALASYGVYKTLDALDPLPFEVPSPSMLFFYTTFRVLYRRWVWRWPLVRRITRIPDLQGTWVGTIRVAVPSAAAQFPTGIPKLCVVTIVQTLYAICISVQTRSSQSWSNSASMFLTPGTSTAELAYSYHATRRHPRKVDLVDHDGTAWLRQLRTRQDLEQATKLPKWWHAVERCKRRRRGRRAKRISGTYFTDYPQHTGSIDVIFFMRKVRHFEEVLTTALPNEIATTHREAIERDSEEQRTIDTLEGIHRRTPPEEVA